MVIQSLAKQVSLGVVVRGVPAGRLRLVLTGLAFLLAALVAALPAHAITVKKVVSPGGITAWLVEDHTNPIITMNFAIRAGAGVDPAGKEGTARLMASLLDEGAGDLDSQAFQRRLEDQSISISFRANYDTFTGALRTLTVNKADGFRLLALALTKPRFDKDPVERMRAQILAQLARRAGSPRYIAQRRWWRARFPGHPYGRPADGTPASLKAITAPDLRAYHKTYLTRQSLVVGVVGDITTKQLRAELDRVFGGLPAKGRRPAISDVKAQTNGKIAVVRLRVPQSFVIFGHNGIKRKDRDFYAAYMMNHVLGGGSFSSRLYIEVREKRGLAYSVYSTLSPMDHGAVIMGMVGTQNARVKQSIDLIRAEWRRMAEKGVTAAELKAAKTYLTGSYPLRFASSSNISRMLVGVQLEDLGIDYFDKRNSYIRAVTADDIMRVAKKLLDPKNLTFVVVGDPKGLKDS